MFQPGYLPAQTLAGRLFIGSTTYAGVTVPAYNATAQKFGLWNPLGSGRNLMLVKLTLGHADATTPAISSLGLSYLANTGSTIATAAPISALTETAPVSGMVGQTPAHVGRFTLSATTSAPAFFYELGFSQDSATPGTGLDTCIHDFDGAVIIPPGTYVGLGGAPLAPGQDLMATLTWIELDA